MTFTPEQVEYLKKLGYSDIESRLDAGINQQAEAPQLTPESIYESYPKKVGRPSALRAIKKAMKRHDPNWLLQCVKAFGQSWAGHDLQYCPYPATWFNQERFMDSPDTWGPSVDQNALQRNLERMRTATEGLIYQHPCNPDSPYNWKIRGMSEPSEHQRLEYKELKEKLLDVRRRIGDLAMK